MVDHFSSFSVLLHYKRNFRSMRSIEFLPNEISGAGAVGTGTVSVEVQHV